MALKHGRGVGLEQILAGRRRVRDGSVFAPAARRLRGPLVRRARPVDRQQLSRPCGLMVTVLMKLVNDHLHHGRTSP